MSDYRKPGEPPRFTRVHALAISGIDYEAPVEFSTTKVPTTRWTLRDWEPSPRQQLLELQATSQPMCQMVYDEHHLTIEANKGLLDPERIGVIVQLTQALHPAPIVTQGELVNVDAGPGEPLRATIQMDAMTPAFDLADLVAYNEARIRAIDNSPHVQ